MPEAKLTPGEYIVSGPSANRLNSAYMIYTPKNVPSDVPRVVPQGGAMLDTFVTGLIRTWVPIAVGALLTWLLRSLGVVIDDQTSAGLTIAVVAIVTGVYYGVLHLLEQAYPAVGRWLLALGLTAGQPQYVKPVKAGRKYADGGTVRPSRM